MQKKAIKLQETVVRSFRLPLTVWKELTEEAEANRRTTAAELIVRLEHSFLEEGGGE